MLTVDHLSKRLPNGKLLLRDINFSVGEGEFVAILGRSGTGKTILLRCINRLTTPDGGEIVLTDNGNLLNITRSDANEIKEVRRRIGMIFQSFNLVKRRSVIENVLIGKLGRSGMVRSLMRRFEDDDIEMAHRALDRVGISDLADRRAGTLSGGEQHLGMVYQNPQMGLRLDVTAGGNIAEKLLAAGWRNVGEIRDRGGLLLKRTEIPLERMDEAPRNFSGGMQQRVQIAKELANDPDVLLLDELTTGLDVSVQARILDLIKEIRRSTDAAMILITHDPGVIKLLSERTIVLKDGRIVEMGVTDQILEDPQHEYTQLLVNSVL